MALKSVWNKNAITYSASDYILQLDGCESVRTLGIIEQCYSSSVIEEAHINDIDEVGEED